MIDGTYNIMLKTPMGVKKGELVFVTDGTALRGAIVVKGVDNPFTSGSVNGDEFTFSGELQSSVGKLVYECSGSVDGDKLTATANAKKGNIKITGSRK